MKPRKKRKPFGTCACGAKNAPLRGHFYICASCGGIAQREKNRKIRAETSGKRALGGYLHMEEYSVPGVPRELMEL